MFSWYWEARKINYDALDRLASCAELGTCSDAQKSVVVFASFQFGKSPFPSLSHLLRYRNRIDLLLGLHFAGWRSGENIWARSIMDGYEYLGHTMLIAYGTMDMVYMHDYLGDSIKLYLAEGEVIDQCVDRNNTVYQHDPMITGDFQDPERRGCIKRKGFEEGIPLWKLFAFQWWAFPRHPWGARWTLSAENYTEWGGGNNQFLGRCPIFLKWSSIAAIDQSWSVLISTLTSGYTIAKDCMAIVVPKRKVNRGFILAKHLEYFEDTFAWPGMLDSITKSLQPMIDTDTGEPEPFTLLAMAGPVDEDGQASPVPPDEPHERILNVGTQSQQIWRENVAASKFMVIARSRKF